MKILAIGDIMGKPGRRALVGLLPDLVKKEAPDFIVVNGENAAGGLGITVETGQEMLAAGADVITSGNHIWHHKEIEEYFLREPRILRPANYPEGTPGKGYCVVKSKGGVKVGVLNLQGLVFMPSIDCPFRKAQEILPKLRKETDIIVVDIHAEATSEKVALAHFLSGQATFVFGTHTHVQTSDERILTGGTAFITDLGMTGPHDSVIGMDKQSVIEKFLTHRHKKFQVAKEGIELNGAIVEVEESTGLAHCIRRIREKLGGQD
jgi:hypothetical protein